MLGRSEESELDSSEYCKQQYWRKPENVPGFIFSREGRLPAVKPAILFICQKVLLASGFSSENRRQLLIGPDGANINVFCQK